MKWSLNQGNLQPNSSTGWQGPIPCQLLKNNDPSMDPFLLHHIPLYGLIYTNTLYYHHLLNNFP